MKHDCAFGQPSTIVISALLLSAFGISLLFAGKSSSAQASTGSAGGSCLRVVRNALGGNVGNWGQAGAPVLFASGGASSTFTGVGPASFTLAGSSYDYSLLGVQLAFTHNTSYSLRVTVSNYKNNYPGSNFEIVGATPSNFAGLTHLNFTGNGVYALLFTYQGADDSYLARVGINVDAGQTGGGGPGGFSISDISLEQLPIDSAVPSEYVTPGYAWGFNYPLMNSFDPTSGLVTEGAGTACVNTYPNIWAVTADSFGANTYSFPNQLANNLAQGYIFFVNSVPGRKLATAQAEIDPLLANAVVIQTDTLLPSTSLPTNAARPNGLIVEGGINDIVQNSSVAQMEAVTASIVSDMESRNLSAILVTVGPFGDNTNWTSAREQVRLAYNDWVRARASAQNGVYVYDMAASVALGGLADNGNPELLAAAFDSGDGLHPNLAGGQQIAQGLSQELDAVGLPVSATAMTVSAGKWTTLTVLPAGVGPFTYQWFMGPTGNSSRPVLGARGSSLTTPPLAVTTSFWVQITAPGGLVRNSAAITITVSGAAPTNAPFPLWALGVLGAALIRIASPRLRSMARFKHSRLFE